MDTSAQSVPVVGTPNGKQKKVITIEKKIDYLQNIMFAIVVVTSLGFITLLVTVQQMVSDSHRFKTEAYDKLTDQIAEQNKDVKLLNKSLKDFQDSNKYQFPASE